MTTVQPSPTVDQATARPAGQPVAGSRAHRDRSRSWPVPAALLALSVIPVAAGTLRLIQLAGGPAIIPADHRFAGFPAALIGHIVGATLYAVVGTVQFVPRFRRRHRTWHRRAGRVLAVAGLLVAASALWLTLFYQPQPGTGDLLYVLRLLFGSAMAACLVLGVTAARRRDIAAHRAWMIRAYAIGLAAGMQVVTEGIGGAIFGTGVLAADLAKAAGWVINLAVAEWVIRRPARRRPTLRTRPQRAGAPS
jgi:uncharacterized membrane protein